LITNPLRGVVTAMATVFEEDGPLDLISTARLAEHLIGRGSEGLVVGGTTGESPTLDDAEKLALLECVLDVASGEVPVVLGTGSNDTRHSVELTARAAEAGASGALVVTPYYNKPNRAGITAHFEAVAAAAPDLPVILYNIPARVIVNVPPDHLAELAQIPNVVAVKQANDDEIGPIEGLDLLAGNDSGLLSVMENGGVGGILVASHFAGERMGDVIGLCRQGDRSAAVALDSELSPIYEAMAVTTNPIPVKAALEMAGICRATMRLPMVEATESEKLRITELLEKGGVTF
jgi:4-hydroxy-tetrahydrodipicolinate synthase